jgi:hypothetical protein
MATGRSVLTGPGTADLAVAAGIGEVATFAPPGEPGVSTPPVTELAATVVDVFLPRIVALADLGIAGLVRLDFRQSIDRLRVIQRTAAVTLALGYGRQPSAADFDDLVVGAIYFDFPIPAGTDAVTILNMGGVALTFDLLVIGMAGPRFESI